MSDKIIVRVKPEIKDLVPGYISHRKSDVVAMKDLLKQGKFDELKVLGHKMKGGGKLYDLDQVTILGDKIEKASIVKDSAPIAEALEILGDYLDRVEVE